MLIAFLSFRRSARNLRRSGRVLQRRGRRSAALLHRGGCLTARGKRPSPIAIVQTTPVPPAITMHPTGSCNITTIRHQQHHQQQQQQQLHDHHHHHHYRARVRWRTVNVHRTTLSHLSPENTATHPLPPPTQQYYKYAAPHRTVCFWRACPARQTCAQTPRTNATSNNQKIYATHHNSRIHAAPRLTKLLGNCVGFKRAPNGGKGAIVAGRAPVVRAHSDATLVACASRSRSPLCCD